MTKWEHDDLKKLVEVGVMAEKARDFLHGHRPGWFGDVVRTPQATYSWTSLEAAALADLLDAGMTLGLKHGLPASLAAQLERMEGLAARDEDDITQTLGRALGYPWYKDDPANFPDATEASGVCVGEHVAASIAAEAAGEITRLKARVAELEASRENLLRQQAAMQREAWELEARAGALESALRTVRELCDDPVLDRTREAVAIIDCLLAEKT